MIQVSYCPFYPLYKSAKTRCDANVKRKVTFLCKTKSDKTNTRTDKKSVWKS